ncbi:MAG: FeoB-associated Cys-rich membrane protein [Proteobacteria bacterium]|nr:FeoB-associated Cys-rich membrane protein [Pseudomonadota bacterium]
MMTLDNIIVAIIITAAAAYVIYYFVKKARSLKKVGPCGHSCDNCPFAKYNNGVSCCHHKQNDKKQA